MLQYFSCAKELNQHYMELCTDTYVLSYIIMKFSSSDIYDLFAGKIPMSIRLRNNEDSRYDKICKNCRLQCLFL